MSISNTCTAKGCSRKVASVFKYGALPEASEFCPDCSRLVLCGPAAPTELIGPEVVLDGERAWEGDSWESRAAFCNYDAIAEPVSRKTPWQIWRDACAWQARAASPQPQTQNIDQLLIEAKAAPRFRDDTYDAVDRLDAAMFSGDEFLGSPEIRQHFRYYLARWEKQLREYDEFDNAMDGDENG